MKMTAIFNVAVMRSRREDGRAGAVAPYERSVEERSDVRWVGGKGSSSCTVASEYADLLSWYGSCAKVSRSTEFVDCMSTRGGDEGDGVRGKVYRLLLLLRPS